MNLESGRWNSNARPFGPELPHYTIAACPPHLDLGATWRPSHRRRGGARRVAGARLQVLQIERRGRQYLSCSTRCAIQRLGADVVPRGTRWRMTAWAQRQCRAPDEPAFSALWPLWPTAISYAVSYLFIAIIDVRYRPDVCPPLKEKSPKPQWIQPREAREFDLPIVERAKRDVASVPPAIAGQHGDVHTFRWNN